MGYLANINVDIKIKQGQQYNLSLEMTNFGSPEDIFDDEWYFTTEADGTHVCWQYYNNYDEASWYIFLHMIAKYIEDGATIECVGEDNSEWIFYKENGKWYEGTYSNTIDKEHAHTI